MPTTSVLVGSDDALRDAALACAPAKKSSHAASLCGFADADAQQPQDTLHTCSVISVVSPCGGEVGRPGPGDAEGNDNSRIFFGPPRTHQVVTQKVRNRIFYRIAWQGLSLSLSADAASSAHFLRSPSRAVATCVLTPTSQPSRSKKWETMVCQTRPWLPHLEILGVRRASSSCSLTASIPHGLQR